MKIDKYVINKKETIQSALNKIESNHLGVIFVEDDYDKIIGVSSSNNIKKYLFKNNNLMTSIISCMNTNYKFIYEDEATRENILKNLISKTTVLPILNRDMQLISVVSDKQMSWNTTSHKPWGYYNLISKTENYLIKKIVIFPQEGISLQKHSFRSEHWIVLSGEAEIIIGEEIIILKESESTFVPVEKKHKISNKYNKPLIILETQLGSKLSETDIIRY